MRETIVLFVFVAVLATASIPAHAAVGSVDPNSELGASLVQQGIGLLQHGQFDQGLAIFNRAVTVSPDNALAWKGLGDANCSLGHGEDAIKDYDRSIKLNAQIPETFNNRGYCNIAIGRFAAALADFGEAIARRPDYPEAYNGLGHAHNELKQYAAAVTDLTKAIALNPDYALAISNRGWSYNGLAQNEAALADFHHALQLAPEYRLAYRGLLIVHQRMNDYAAMVQDFDNWVGDDKAAATLNSRCWIRAQANLDLDSALAACDGALKLAPKEPAFLDSRALVRLRRGDWRGAIADADQALAVNAKMPGTLFVRGLAKKQLSDGTGGDADIAAAKAITPNIADVYAAFGVKP